MLIYVPSTGRATPENIRMGPLLRLPPEWQARTYIVVYPEEVEAYIGVLEEAGLLSVTVLASGQPERGIGAKRLWIAEHARSLGEERILMMDDDIDFLVRKSDDDWRLEAQDLDDTRIMLGHIDMMLQGQHAMVGISSREGNNRVGTGAWSDANMIDINTRVMRMWGVRVADFLSVEHGRVPVMEDFDIGLQLLRSGRTNCCLYYWANGQRQTNMAGGCSTIRTREVQDAAARQLAKLHAPHVRLRQKNNKTDADGLGTRTEVTVAWKRAAAEGAARG